MNQVQIMNLLHHRPPYLMVSAVTEMSEESIEVIKVHHGDEAHVKGHFPGAPVVPGAMLQEICTQAGGLLITKFYSPVLDYSSETTKGHALGVLKKVHFAKYSGIVKPGAEIRAKVELIDRLGELFKFKASVVQDKIVKAKLSFSLVNISDEHLF